jgi:hypothetical protein
MPWYTGSGQVVQNISIGHAHLVETSLLCLYTHRPPLSIKLPLHRMKILHFYTAMRIDFIMPK